VVAISQGSSERNISIVVAAEEKVRALRAVHGAFGLDVAEA
jgi:aspartokinase